MQQRSAEWYEARCGRITGSRFVKAMAARNTQAYRGLLDDLVRERSTKQVDSGYVSDAMQWGIDHEDNARRWYAKAHKCVVREVGFVVHPQFDFVGVSPDGLVSHDGLIEIKCPQHHNYMKVADSRQLPSQYRWQVQGQLWVCQRMWLHFVCFYPPKEGVVVPVFGNAADFDRLANRCAEIDSEVRKRLGRKSARNSSPSTPAPARSAITPVLPSSARQLPQRDPIPADMQGSPDKNEGVSWWMVCVVMLAAIAIIRAFF